MLLCIANVLTPDELNLIVSKLATAEFVDGKITAGWHARLVKHNTQMDASAPVGSEVKNLVMSALQRNALFQMAVRPKLIRPPLFSRYQVGMSYGSHVDNALMGDPLMRSDVSLTLFLSPSDTYDGGELVLETPQGEEEIKLDAGAMAVYPSSTLHRVEPVTRGTRLVAVTWIQSLVRDAHEREILFDLDTARQAIFDKYGKTPEFDLISKSHANLLRKWVDL
ncbi:Fe2+-dependent dioxygenase [Leptolyngbya sp. NK1-12]|uniref:Fe2+-dependent dioxygenase n=1 Tax=Leptolyngbya sp. NK1-12 TaxID=2547451 RepID=A0AA96WI31_9CYAN|nr:Fe2+-dependent dioxygenase [Leptolyngbya sp. NK1-12]WNZ25509.1 Fe2+-dependent dioxygenase [Leptolyngbya sp. NK1-12]